MFCYKCGAALSQHDFCTGCGADVGLYKKTISISNRFYNDALEKASVRDLTGAIESLRQCLKFNKNQVEARNLLGLLYFETGEVVAALSEWTISTNSREKKNIANDYLSLIQSNPTQREIINQSIKKYNLALAYCGSDKLDIAVIQLKKVVQQTPKFIKARQLLALLYINSEEWEEAREQLLACAQIDRGNTITNRYLKEVEERLTPIEDVGVRKRRKKSEPEVIRYKSDNELVIQPVNSKENHGLSTLLNLALGLLIGLAVAWFLILPAQKRNLDSKADANAKAISEELDARNADVEELEQKLERAQREKEDLAAKLETFTGSDGTLRSIDYLIKGAAAYLQDPDDLTTIAESLNEVNPESGELDEEPAAMELYNSLLAAVGPKLTEQYYEVGYSAYSDGDYSVAIENLTKAYSYDSTNGDALFYLAQSYNKDGDEENALRYYQMVVDNFEGTERAAKAKEYVTQLEGLQD